jgi:hypothetical protein
LPWVVSDFSLMDAIESGIVKVLVIPVDDDAPEKGLAYRELWDKIDPPLPKKVKKDVEYGATGWCRRSSSKARCAVSTQLSAEPRLLRDRARPPRRAAACAGGAWKPDATGKRCERCARTWNGHAGSSCYPAIDAFDPPRTDLLEVTDPADASPPGPRRAVPPASRRRAGRVPHRHGGPQETIMNPRRRPATALTATPAPYDGRPFAPIGELTAAEHAWGRGLVARAWPEAGTSSGATAPATWSPLSVVSRIRVF